VYLVLALPQVTELNLWHGSLSTQGEQCFRHPVCALLLIISRNSVNPDNRVESHLHLTFLLQAGSSA
jgi:hypothetical protein